MSSVYAATAIATPDLLNQWANVIVGNWLIQAGDVGNGTLAAKWNISKTAIMGSFQLNNKDIPSGVWTVALDPTSGLLKQTQVNSDGSKSVTTISNQGPNQWTMSVGCVTQAGAQGETETTFCTVSSDGNSLTHKVTNRLLNGQALPDIAVTFTRTTAQTTAAAVITTPVPSLLARYAKSILGEWDIAVPGFGTGSFSASWNADFTGLQGHFQLSGVPSGTWTLGIDPSTGQLLQKQTNSDGSTNTISIVPIPTVNVTAAAQVPPGGYSEEYAMTNGCASGAAAATAPGAASGRQLVESSNTLAGISIDGNTMNHKVTNRVKNGQAQPDINVVFTRAKGAAPTASATVPVPSLLARYAKSILGEWSISVPGFGTGSFSAAWNAEHTALQGHFQLNGVPSGTWTIAVDPLTGQLVQNQMNSDGTTNTVNIVPVPSLPASRFAEVPPGGYDEAYAAANGCESAAADQIAAARAPRRVESSNTLATIKGDGTTMTHKVTNRVKNGTSQPDIDVVFTRLSRG
jgi:hypothetical protein